MPADKSAIDSIVAKWSKYYTAALSDSCQFRCERTAGLKVYWDSENGGSWPFRLGKVSVNCSAEKYAEVLWNYPLRAEWDSLNTDAIEELKVETDTSKLVWLLGKPKPGLSARDFVFHSTKIPQDDGSFLFVQTDAAKDPAKPEDQSVAVRGNVNTLMYIKPAGESSCDITYIMEIQVNGWVPNFVVDAVIDDVPESAGLQKVFCEK
eukprot:Clim_evm3s103 gene=Clim_evmTU3s103